MNQKGNIQTKSQTYLREQILKWREERQSRLAARVLHHRKGHVSSAVFGTFSSANETKINTNQQTITSTVPKSKPLTKTKPNHVPEVKHTLASKLRMIKANPLLEVRGIITLPEKKKTLSKNSIQEKSIIGQETKLTSHSTRQNSHFQKTSIPSSGNQKTTLRFANKKPAITKNNTLSSGKKCLGVRRSLSADATPRKSNDSCTSVSEQNNAMRRFHSVADIQGPKVPIIEEEDEFENDIFPLPMTPVTPYTQTPRKSRFDRFSNTGRKSITSPSSVFMPTPEVMRKQLSQWLQKRGKSLGSFHHLHCFGLHASQTEKPRHVQKVNTPKRCSLMKDPLKNNTQFSSAKDTTTVQPKFHKDLSSQELHAHANFSEEDKENVYIEDSYLLAKDALGDLVKIVELGCPLEQCNQWLAAIRKEFPAIKEVPIYWECLAALEEARGDFKSAVDCYERAIIRGASTDKIGDSLDQLMVKFNLLNLNMDLNKDGSSKTPRKQVLDARNIFKSTIIKFALQQKAVRRLSTNIGLPASSLNYYVTPVRRSTRTSVSRYSVTPGVLCVKSLNQLEPEVRNTMVFQPNSALD